MPKTGRNRWRTLMRNAWLAAFVVATCANFHLAAQSNAESYELREQWELVLTDKEPPLGWRASVCADGRIYVGDVMGMVRIISPNGSLTSVQQVLPPRKSIEALACDGQGGHVYVFDGQHEVIGTLRDGSIEAVESFPLHHSVQAPLVGPDGSVYLLSMDETAHPLFVRMGPNANDWQVIDSGPVPSQFGIPEGARFESPGIVTWDSNHRRVLYVFQGQTTIRSFDPSLPSEPGVQALGEVHLFPAFSVPFAIASLAGGRFVSEVFTTSEIADAFNTQRLVVMDQSFKTLWSGPQSPELGLLAGTSEDGGVYFSTPSSLQRFALARTDSTNNLAPGSK